MFYALYTLHSLGSFLSYFGYFFNSKVEIPKHELEHTEAAIEEKDDDEDPTQFEVDMVKLTITINSSITLCGVDVTGRLNMISG